MQTSLVSKGKQNPWMSAGFIPEIQIDPSGLMKEVVSGLLAALITFPIPGRIFLGYLARIYYYIFYRMYFFSLS